MNAATGRYLYPSSGAMTIGCGGTRTMYYSLQANRATPFGIDIPDASRNSLTMSCGPLDLVSRVIFDTQSRPGGSFRFHIGEVAAYGSDPRDPSLIAERLQVTKDRIRINLPGCVRLSLTRVDMMPGWYSSRWTEVLSIGWVFVVRSISPTSTFTGFLHCRRSNQDTKKLGTLEGFRF